MTRRDATAIVAAVFYQQSEPPASFAGVLKRVDGSKLILELHDGNAMEFRTTKKTKYVLDGKPAKAKDLVEGQVAEIDGRFMLGIVEAVTVTQNAAKPQQN